MSRRREGRRKEKGKGRKKREEEEEEEGPTLGLVVSSQGALSKCLSRIWASGEEEPGGGMIGFWVWAERGVSAQTHEPLREE
jgi:hypothetical protein